MVSEFYCFTTVAQADFLRSHRLSLTPSKAQSSLQGLVELVICLQSALTSLWVPVWV